MSPTLDHVVPLVAGGLHDPANVRLAHLTCNSRKGAKAANEQLLLFG
jgi:5-methylcytosine-specific restriction endonuclease McrA